MRPMSDFPRELAIRTTLLPRDTNAAGAIFGGVILSQIDMAGAIPGHKLNPERRFVTVAMDEVVSHRPVFVGDLLSIYAQVVKVGRSSFTAKVDVMVERRHRPGDEVQVTEAQVTYVAVDENRVPVPIFPDAE